MSTLKKLPVKFNNDGCSLIITGLSPKATEQDLTRLADESTACRIFEKEIQKVNKDGSVFKIKKYTGFLKFSSNTLALQNLYKLRELSLHGIYLNVLVKKSQEQIAIDKKHEHQRWLEEQREIRREQREKRKQEQRKLFEERQKAIEEAPRSEPVRTGPVRVQVPREPRVRQEPPVELQDWKCRDCGVYNFSPRKNCLKCKAERKWNCKKCNELVSINNMSCTSCKTERDPKPWFCGECDWKNRPISEKCYSCEALRSKATVRKKSKPTKLFGRF